MRWKGIPVFCLLVASCVGKVPLEEQQGAALQCVDVFNEEEGWHQQCQDCAPSEQIFTDADGWHCPTQPSSGPTCARDPMRCDNLCDQAQSSCFGQWQSRDL